MGKRQRILFLMVLCLVLGLLASTSFAATWATGLLGRVGGNYDGGNQAMQQSADGGFLLLGGDIYGNPTLNKLDLNGNVVWGKSYSGAPAGGVISKLSDGGGIIVADNWVGRVDAAGTLLWQYTLTGGPSQLLPAVSVDGTSVYLAGGDDSFNLYVAKVSLATQQLLWSKVVGLGRYVEAVRATKDGGCILMTSVSVGTNDDGLLVKVDANGTAPKTMTFGTSPGEERFYDVVEPTTGVFVVLGQSENWGQGHSDVMLLKLTPNANWTNATVNWKKTYGAAGEEWGARIDLLDSNNCVFSGHTYSYSCNGKKDGWLVKVALSNGNIVLQKRYWMGADVDLTTLVATPKSAVSVTGCLLAGAWRPFMASPPEATIAFRTEIKGNVIGAGNIFCPAVTSTNATTTTIPTNVTPIFSTFPSYNASQTWTASSMATEAAYGPEQDWIMNKP
jgi:hypothetical protein